LPGDSGARVAIAGNSGHQHQLAPARQLERIVVLDGRPLPDDARGVALTALESSGTVAGVDAQAGTSPSCSTPAAPPESQRASS